MAQSMRRGSAVEIAAQYVAPEIVTVSGVVEIFADVALVELFDDMARIKLGRREGAKARTYEQCGLVLMPARSFIASHGFTHWQVEHAGFALERGH